MKRLIALFCLIPTLAFGQAMCADREKFMTALEDKLGQSLHAYGISDEGSVLELFVNQSESTWAIIVTYLDGSTCLVSGGRGFEFMPAVLGEAL